MVNQPQFTKGWKAAVICSIVLAILAGSTAQQRVEEKNLANDERLADLEKRVQKIEDFLYNDVSDLKYRVQQRSEKNEQRMAEIEGALKRIEQARVR